MCLLVFYVNPNPGPDEFALVLINIRDEQYDRPAKPLAFWETHTNVIGGMDMEPGKEGGTWLAMNKNGKIAALLNILQPSIEILPDKKGRGTLPVGFVTSSEDCMHYLKEVQMEENDYNGFLLVTLDFRSLQKPVMAYFSKFTNLPPVQLKPGIHAYGNCIAPEEPWPRAVKAKERLSQIISAHGFTSSKDILVDKLFCMLQDQTCNGICENMKKQGKDKTLQFLNRMSSFFIKIPEANYGSRCHSVILIDSLGNADFYEKGRRHDTSPYSDEPWISNHFAFRICESNDAISSLCDTKK